MKLKKCVALGLSAVLSAGMVLAPFSEAYASNLNFKSTAYVTDMANHTITTKKVKVYWVKWKKTQTMNIHFVDGNKAVPYFEIEDFMKLKNEISKEEKRGSVIKKCDKKDDVATLIRDNKSICVFDFKKSTIHFDNFDKFIQYGFSDALVNTTWRYETFSNGTAKYLEQQEGTNNCNGAPVTLDLADYNINLVHQDSMYLVPVQTMSDIFLGEVTDFIVFNGKDLFIDDDNVAGGTFGEQFLSVKKGPRSKELAEYNYNELALTLDFNYGQQEEQNIPDFRTFFKNTGLKKYLLSSDPVKASKAYRFLLNRYFGAGHNGLNSDSYLLDANEKVMEKLNKITSLEWDKYRDTMGDYLNAREQFYSGFPDEFPKRYEEVGDTAYIIFDSFYFPSEDYYNIEVTKDDIGSVYRDGINIIGLIKYAHQQITRPNSPIKNVVIDLSCNSGGDVDAGIYLLAWIMGKAPISIRDKATGATTTSYYRCDANYDKKYDQKDSLNELGKKVYCLISPVSFSCGNFVPSVLKATQSATILGRTSGGGTCSVLPMGAADGTAFHISSRQELCTVKNGTYYNVDQGVEPDVYFANLESFYNRSKLTEIIDSLK